MGGSNGMQRSGGSVRTVMAVCLGGLVLMTVLYLTKRVESNRTHRELDLVKIESRDITEGLNNKLMECVEKVESLTQESTVIGGELKNCKDTKANLMTQTQGMKSENEECEKQLKISADEKSAAEEAIKQAHDDRDSALLEKQAAENELQDLQEDNANIQTQVDQCEEEKERLNSQRDNEGRCNAQLATIQEKLRTATDKEASLMSQIQALTSQKKSLEARVSQLLAEQSQAQVANNGGRGEPPAQPLSEEMSPEQQDRVFDVMKQLDRQGAEKEGFPGNQDDGDDNLFIGGEPRKLDMPGDLRDHMEV